MKTLAMVALALGVSGCSCSPSPGQDGGSQDGGGPGDGGGNQFFTYVTLVPNASWPSGFLATALGPQDRIGVAYFAPGDGGIDGSVLLDDGGTGSAQIFANVDIRYVEWSPSGGVSAPQNVVTVQEQGVRGLSVAFQPNGEPAVAYFGGPNKGTASNGTPVPGGGNPYWFQQNAMLSRRQADHVTWQETMIDDYSTNVLPTNGGNTAACLYNATGPDSNSLGMILGIYPALAIDSAGVAYLAYRDVHQGNFPKQDWESSDLKMAKVPTSWTQPSSAGSLCGSNANACTGVAWGGSNHSANPGIGEFGGHNALVLGANGMPAIASDQVAKAATGQGHNILFFQYNAAATWACSGGSTDCGMVTTPVPWAPVYCQSSGGLIYNNVTNTDTGPSLAWDPPSDGGLGYGLAFVDRDSNQLSFAQSIDGTSWGAADMGPLGQGTGGWNPSLAIDPVLHEPHIAFFMCTGSSTPPCALPSATDLNGANIQIVFRVAGGAGGWQYQIVDKDGASNPKLSFLSTGKRAVVYVLTDGSLRLALER